MGNTSFNARIPKVNKKVEALEMSRAKRISEVLATTTSESTELDTGRVKSLNDLDHTALHVDPLQHTYVFENLVMEGGGSKGMAYCGAVRYLEEIGVMDNIKRFAGCSVGGVLAMMLAVGYNSHDLEGLTEHLELILYDGTHSFCGLITLIPRLRKQFGVHPGMKFFEWLGERIRAKTDNKDITFKELYDKYNRELCIVVTNVNMKSTEYLHPKTTPDMPIRLAARMTMSIPGVFEPVKYQLKGCTDLFVDGGMLCNFPIYVFDGWFLSMKTEDSFMRRMCRLNKMAELMERKMQFSPPNNKTLGIMVYADMEDEAFKFDLDQRCGCLEPKEPATKTRLYRKYLAILRKKCGIQKEHKRVVHALDTFLKMAEQWLNHVRNGLIETSPTVGNCLPTVVYHCIKVLNKHNLDRNDAINIDELQAVFEDENEFPKEMQVCLFGNDFTVCDAFKLLDKNKDGDIDYNELMNFVEDSGVILRRRFYGFDRKEILTFRSYLQCLMDTVYRNTSKLYIDRLDFHRTIGINSGYLGTMNFNMEEADRKFAIARGYNATRAFFQYHVAVKNCSSSRSMIQETDVSESITL